MILGIDYGTSKVGLAAAENKKGAVAVPLMILHYSGDEQFFDELKQVIRDYGVTDIVVGNPFIRSKRVSESGEERYRLFIENIERLCGIAPTIVDEHFSTQAARHLAEESTSKRNSDDDAHAAQVFLQSYIDAGLS